MGVTYQSPRSEQEEYLVLKGWQHLGPTRTDFIDWWLDPLEADTWQPFGEAVLIQMRRDGIPTPETEP